MYQMVPLLATRLRVSMQPADLFKWTVLARLVLRWNLSLCRGPLHLTVLPQCNGDLNCVAFMLWSDPVRP